MMNRASLLLASLPLLLLAACGGVVESEGTGAGTGSSTTGPGSTSGTGGTGASTSTGTTGTGASTTTGTFGTGGSTSTGTFGTGGDVSTTTTGTGAGGGACEGYVDLVVGNGAPLHLTSDCASDSNDQDATATASGFLTEGGPSPGVSLVHVFGCVTKGLQSQGLAFYADDVTGPGTSVSGTATYTDAQGSDWTSVGGFDVTITKLGAVGDTIEGTLGTAVTHPPSDIAEPITATFKVCHIKDELVP
jgi:hypothetical protein